MRWCLILEEDGPELCYIKGENNVVADALSRLDLTEYATTTTTKPERSGSSLIIWQNAMVKINMTSPQI